jgi:Family of unknown function (DUF6157)
VKIHTTNYQDTFIAVADDCPAIAGEVPPSKGEKKSIAMMQFEILSRNPYKFTSDEVLFEVFAQKNDLTESELAVAREQFFSKGQACFRASPLTKRYGWGVHSDANGRIAMYDSASEEYEKLMNDENIKTVKAMKSSR